MDVLPSCYFRFHLIPEDSLEFLGIILFRDLGDSFGIYQDSSGVIRRGGVIWSFERERDYKWNFESS